MEQYMRAPMILGETQQAYRERIALLNAEAAERRQQQIDEQSSPLHSPSVRIRAWERLHQVDLPSDPAHRLIEVIATNTGLSADEVRAEQQARTTATG
jgi:hypothetical protein